MAGAMSGRVSASSLSDPRSFTSRELDALVKRLIKTKAPNLRDEIGGLSPKEKAYIATTKEFHILMLSMAVDAVAGFERMTRSQWKAVAWFKTKGPFRDDEKPEKEGEIFEVEATNGSTPIERELNEDLGE